MTLHATVTHRLAAALRIVDHFTGLPVPEQLEVGLLPGSARPVRTQDGTTTRHRDGTYRFSDLAPGRRLVRVHSPSGRWTRWDDAPFELVLPVADPRRAVEVTMWPTGAAQVPFGLSAIRGKLLGAAATPGRVVRIEPDGLAARGRFTRVDGDGLFLFLLPGAFPLDAAGRLRLTASVDGAVVTGIRVEREAATSGSTAHQFASPAGRAVTVHLFT